MTCLFQNKTKISGKADEAPAPLPGRATTSSPIPFAPPSSSFCSVSLSRCVGTLAFVQLGGVTDLRLSRRSITRPLLIYTAAVDSYATSRTPGVRHVHPHTGAQNVGVWDATSPHRLPELRREGVRERGTQL